MQKSPDTSAIRLILDSILSVPFHDHNQPEQLLQTSDELLRSSIEAGFTYGITAAYYLKGSIYTDMGDNDRGLPLLEEAAAYGLLSSGTLSLLPKIYNNLGRAYHNRDDLHKAVSYYIYALSLARHYFPETDMSHTYLNLSQGVLHTQQSYAAAMRYLDKAETAACMAGNRYMEIYTTLLRGTSLIYTGDFEGSLPYLRQSLREAEDAGYQRLVCYSYINLGTALHYRKQTDSAIYYLQYAGRIADSMGWDDVYTRLSQMLLLGAALREAGRYGESEILLTRVLDQVVEMHHTHMIRPAQLHLIALYRKTGDHRKIADLSWQFMLLNDSLTKLEMAKAVSATESRFRVAEKEKEILSKQLQIARQEKSIDRKNMWITTLILCAALVSLLAVSIHRNQRASRRIFRQQMDTLKQQQEIDRLRATVQGAEEERTRIARELHDNMGSLLGAAQMNMISLRRDVPEVADAHTYNNLSGLIGQLSGSIRETAHSMMPELLIRNSLPEAVRHFCAHLLNPDVRITYQNLGNFSGIGVSHKLSVYRIIQELIHNILKHASARSILLQLQHEDNVLSLTVEDDGVGFDTAGHPEGMGLKSIRTRVQALEGSCSIRSRPGKGTSIYIEIPHQMIHEESHITT